MDSINVKFGIYKQVKPPEALIFFNISEAEVDCKAFVLTLAFPMFPFDPPENIKINFFLMFSGGSKGNIGKK